MNITVISFFFLPEYSGGAKQWASLMKGMKESCGLNFSVIAARLKPEWPKREIIDGIRVTRVNVDGNDALFSFWIRAALELWKKRLTIDLVQANGLKPAHGFPLWFAHYLGKPTVGRLSIANSDVSFSRQGRLLGKFHKWCLNRVDKYIAISSALAQELSDVGFSTHKCVQLHNGVDLNVFKPVSEKERKLVRMKLGLGDETVLLFVGVIDGRKGVDVLIPAFQRVAAVRSNVRLMLVGPGNRDDKEGKYIDDMKIMTCELGISEKVEFRDYTKDVTQYYHVADLFVLPSRNEGMPNVVLEAMACGLPVIGTKISGTEDLIVPGKNGLLIPVGDEVGLADAINQLIDDPKKRHEMGEIGLNKVQQFHNINDISGNYAKVYEELLGI